MIFYSEKKLPLELNRFPDGTFRLNAVCENKDGGKPFPIIWQYENEAELAALIFLAKHIKSLTSRPVELYIPYLPNARMDRVKHEDEVFTLKYFCEIINSLGFEKVTVLDVHSAVSAALLDRAENIEPQAYIEKAMKSFGFDYEKDCIFFPDEGSFKRYSAYDAFKACGNISFGIKKREWETGKILGLDITGADVKDRNIFIIDDICSYGGTVYHSALKLKELGCKKIGVFFTHCENSIKDGKLFEGELIDRIYTTNSICTVENDKLVRFDCF
ncbi:MAG: ribose-phosphate pyrophosphokinase [Oscillospiraceae bacterium]|nr:ribose-phosphate pyrophosphokinase [Oscillospiraceae bacterium]